MSKLGITKLCLIQPAPASDRGAQHRMILGKSPPNQVSKPEV